MKYVAYHRTSTKEQHLDRGIAELTKYCKTHNIQLYKSKVYTDQRTGKDFDRPRYIMLKEEILESGDVLIVTELDRLGRNKEATLKELRFFKDNGIRVMVLELPTTLIDLSAMENSMARMMLETINNMMIELYASMAQAEIEKKEKRQREGIEAKKARGEWDDYGRPRVMDLEEFATHYRLVQQGEKKPFELMKELGMTNNVDYNLNLDVEFNLMNSAFISGTAEYCTVFEPTASEYEQAGTWHIVASVGEQGGDIPYTSFIALGSYIEKNADTIKSFLKAIKKAHEFMNTHTELEVAEAIVKQFPSTSIKSIETSLKSYKTIEAWKTDLQATENSFTRLQDIMENSGELSARVPFDKIVDNSLAQGVFG